MNRKGHFERGDLFLFEVTQEVEVLTSLNFGSLQLLYSQIKLGSDNLRS